MNPAETGLYYVSDRYYDSETGRWINTDEYASTGQEILGYNMFAYCLNSPVNGIDESGNKAVEVCFSDMLAIGIVAMSSIAIVAVGVNRVKEEANVDSLAVALEYRMTKPYREARETAKAIAVECNIRTPNVHHIVPRGEFSARSPKTIEKLRKVQDILNDVGIGLEHPLNLMLVSPEHHAKLHTNGYIERIYKWINPAKGDRKAVIGALNIIRLDIASGDKFSFGY